MKKIFTILALALSVLLPAHMLAAENSTSVSPSSTPKQIYVNAIKKANLDYTNAIKAAAAAMKKAKADAKAAYAASQKAERVNKVISVKTQQYCNNKNVDSVYVSETYIQVVSKLVGGGSAFYPVLGGSSVQCPVVSPDSASAACKNIIAKNQFKKVCESSR